MGTIIAVHGTFATGLEDGDDWWQKGSELERDIREWVSTEHGQLDFQPFVWDGRNSELSRRAAAKALAARASTLERRGQNYCLVGHSHGGSIVAQAVFDLCSRNGSVSSLSRWITIGTPFLSMQKRRFLLSRLGLAAKIGYLTFLLMSMWLAACFIFAVASPENARIAAKRPDISTQWDVGLIIRLFVIAFICFIPLILLHLWLRSAERRRLRIYIKKYSDRVAKKAHHRWLALWHSADEAMRGLQAVPRIAFPIFSKRFLLPPLSLAAVFAAPFLLALLLSWALGGQEFYEGQGRAPTGDFGFSLPGSGTRLFGPDNPFSAIGILFYRIMYKLMDLAAAGTSPSLMGASALPLTFMTIAALFFVFSGLFLSLVAAFSVVLSVLLSRALDRTTWAQLRQSAYGNDTTGEIAIGARIEPMWTSLDPAPLPSGLSEELRDHADRAAAHALPKLRGAVQALAFSEQEMEKSDLLAEYLTWDELIHTAYFKVQRFRMLVAYAIAQSPGFRPSAALTSHPDYELVAGWYEELERKPKGQISAQPAQQLEMGGVLAQPSAARRA